eukprot:5388035-Prymnesium_polylepis.1
MRVTLDTSQRLRSLVNAYSSGRTCTSAGRGEGASRGARTARWRRRGVEVCGRARGAGRPRVLGAAR